MSLSNLIKNILNIQDNNISFPEEEYCQVTKKGDYQIKVFKGFLKKDYCTCPHCNSKNIVNLVSRAFNQTRISIMNSIQDDSLKRKLKLFWKSLLKYYPDLCQINYYCHSFKHKLSSKDIELIKNFFCILKEIDFFSKI